MADAPVKVPKELLVVSATVLEDYVRSRLLQFIKRFGVSLGQLLPGFTPALLDRAVLDSLRALPLPDYGQVPLERRQLQLVFRHDCQALGCLEQQCPLCQHNCKRRCTVNFCKKYLVNDRMLARCGAQIRIEVIDRATGRLCDSDLSDIFLEVFILNGASYDQRFLDATRTSSLSRADSSNPDSVAALNKDLDDCALLANNKGKPLLASLAGGKTTDDGKLLIQAVRGRVVLPDLAVTDSSEALLSGRKPPFRLVVRAKHKRGQHISLRPAVSEPFVVATRRVKTSHKAEIPTMDDPVAKLMHMGKETCRKLADLHTAAQQASMELDLEQHLACVEKVGDFKALALRAEGDSQLRSTLQTLLKLPKDKWEECVSHAKRAVFPDNRPRAWFADRTGTVGLLFSATLGVVDLKRPEALLQRVLEPTGGSRLQVIPQQQQTPLQRDAVRQLLPQAEECWWSPGHIGWTLFDTLTGDAVQATPSPVLGPLPQLAGGPLPVTASGKGLLMAAPAATGNPAGLNLTGLPQQLLQQYAAANMAALQEASASQAAVQAAAGVVLPHAPELSLGMGPPPALQQQQAIMGAPAQAAAAAAGGGVSTMAAQTPLQEPVGSSGFGNPAWMQNSPAAQSPMHPPAQQQQQLQLRHSSAAAQQASPAAQQQQQQQMATTHGRPPTAPQSSREAPGSATLKTPPLPSAFAALAAQPITANDASQEGTPPAAAPATASASPAPPPAAAAGSSGTGAAAAKGSGNSGNASSGLGSSLQHSRSSGVSWLPPLSGRKRSYAIASGGVDSINGRVPTSAAAPAGPSHQSAPTSQLSADMERLLNAAGFNPSPSLSTFPSMGLFVDTVSPAAAAGGAGGSLLRPGTAPTRTASAGLSRLLSLDLASLLRGTSMFPTPGAIPGVQGMGSGCGGGGSAGGLGVLDVSDRVDDDGLPTPHAAAAAEGLMALGDPMLGSLPDLHTAAVPEPAAPPAAAEAADASGSMQLAS